ncbi:MAG: hypothetical protein HYV27_18380 [Candidatus Hydrogenedentes bacterium]|nr:hypothetical protein [Candidatus Hydrogenedentota bacterium]
MSKLHDLEQAILQLNAAELSAFRTWFENFDEAHWDREIESTPEGGRLDEMVREALEAYRVGCRKKL